MNLKDKVVLVTGSSRGIGKQIALAFAKEGSKVILNGRKPVSPELLAEFDRLQVDYRYLQADLSQVSEIEKLAAGAAEFGSVDILVNNAGITHDKLMLGMKLKDFDEVLNVNLRGSFYLSQMIFKQMLKKRSGLIINLSSVVGLHGNVGQANYAASKAALIGLTKTIAREGASRSVRANAIAPGMIVSDMTDALSEKIKEQMQTQIPLGRFGNAEEIAQTAIFLAQNDYITGQTIVVDGGMTI